MPTLNTILARHLPPDESVAVDTSHCLGRIDLGQPAADTSTDGQDGDVITSAPTFNAVALSTDLNGALSYYRVLTGICVAMIVGIFVVIVLAAVSGLNNSEKLGALSVSGVTVGGLITWMMSLIRELRDTQVIATLALSVDMDTLERIIRLMRKR